MRERINSTIHSVDLRTVPVACDRESMPTASLVYSALHRPHGRRGNRASAQKILGNLSLFPVFKQLSWCKGDGRDDS